MDFGDARLPQRFWDKVEIDEQSGCWLWTASTDPSGYGYFTINGRKNAKAHRVMMEAMTGQWPGAAHVLHSCDRPPCVQPQHLRIGTHSDNMRDRSARGRAPGQSTTHCRNGHEWTPENTTPPSGPGQGRKCKTCNRLRMREPRE